MPGIGSLGNLNVNIGANTKNLESGLARTSSLIRDFSLVATGLFGGVTNAFKTIASVGIKSVTVAMAGLITGFTLVAKSGAEFQDNIVRAFTIMQESSGSSKQALADLTKEAIRLGDETLFSANQAAEGLLVLSRAGFSARDSIAAIGPVVDLAVVANLGLSETSNIATAAMFGFGIEAGKMSKVADVLALASSQANTTVELLGSALSFVAPVAHSAGISIEETAAAIGVLSNAGIRGCYDDKTDVLTIDGFKKWSEVTMDDSFATINPDTHEIEYQKPIGLVDAPYEGDMYVVKNKHIDLKVTPNHWMYVKKRGKDKFERIQAESLYGKESEYLVTGNWTGKDEEFITLPGFKQNRGSWIKNISELNIKTDNFLEFLGWYLSDGHCDLYNGNYRVAISQNKNRYFNEIKTCLDRLPFHYNIVKSRDNCYKFVILNQQLYNYVHHLGNCYNKYVPKEIKLLNKYYLEVFYKAFCKGDVDKEGRLYTSSVKLRDDLEEILLKLGYGAKHIIKTPKGAVNYIRDRKVTATADNYQININKKQLTPSFYQSEYNSPKHSERLKGLGTNIVEKWEYYNGRIYCAEVPNHLLIVRRNGKVIVCGNSRAGTTLRRALNILLAPTGRAKKIFDELGLSFTTTEGKLESFTTIIRKLNKANLTAAQTQTIFGRIAGPGMAALLRQGSSALDGLTGKLEDADGAADRMSQAFRTTVKGRIADLGASVVNLGLAFSEEFNKPLADTIFGIRNYVKSTKEALDGTGFFSNVVKGVIKALEPLTNKIKEVAKTFQEWITGLTASDISEFFDTVRSKVQQFIDKISDPQFQKNVVEFFKGAKDAVMLFVGSFINIIKLFEKMPGVLQVAGAAVVGYGATFIGLMGGMVNVVALIVSLIAIGGAWIKKSALMAGANAVLTNSYRALATSAGAANIAIGAGGGAGLLAATGGPKTAASLKKIQAEVRKSRKALRLLRISNTANLGAFSAQVGAAALKHKNLLKVQKQVIASQKVSIFSVKGFTRAIKGLGKGILKLLKPFKFIGAFLVGPLLTGLKLAGVAIASFVTGVGAVPLAIAGAVAGMIAFIGWILKTPGESHFDGLISGFKSVGDAAVGATKKISSNFIPSLNKVLKLNTGISTSDIGKLGEKIFGTKEEQAQKKREKDAKKAVEKSIKEKRKGREERGLSKEQIALEEAIERKKSEIRAKKRPGTGTIEGIEEFGSNLSDFKTIFDKQNKILEEQGGGSIGGGIGEERSTILAVEKELAEKIKESGTGTIKSNTGVISSLDFLRDKLNVLNGNMSKLVSAPELGQEAISKALSTGATFTGLGDIGNGLGGMVPPKDASLEDKTPLAEVLKNKNDKELKAKSLADKATISAYDALVTASAAQFKKFKTEMDKSSKLATRKIGQTDTLVNSDENASLK